MKKLVKKYGDSNVVVFSKDECKIHNIKPGTILDLCDMIVVNNGKSSKIQRKRRKQWEK